MLAAIPWFMAIRGGIIHRNARTSSGNSPAVSRA